MYEYLENRVDSESAHIANEDLQKPSSSCMLNLARTFQYYRFYPCSSVVINLGFANPQGFTGRFSGVLGWQLSFHVLLFFNILY